jgi:hypothetical protein
MILTTFPSLIIRHEEKMRNNSRETDKHRQFPFQAKKQTPKFRPDIPLAKTAASA